MFARPLRFRPDLIAALLGGAAVLCAQPAPLPPEIAAALAAPIPAWEFTGNLRTSAGHKDNVLLSAVRADASAFARAELEVFGWRPPTARFEVLAFANAAFTRFLDSAENPREWQAFAHTEARWFAAPPLVITGTAEGYHLDQVFDLSASHAERLTAQLAVSGVLVSTAARWQLRPTLWLELKPALQRDRYRDGSDDHTQRTGRAAVGRSFRGGRIELSLAAQELRRNYDRRPRYTVGGRPLAGADLDFVQRDAEFAAVVAWDDARRWTTTTTIAAGRNSDNGSGFFDYRRRSARQELAWTAAPWRVQLATRALRYDYDVQTQGIGLNPPHRLKEEFLGHLRLERAWGTRATVFADYLWERSRSNDVLISYRVRTAAAGVDWAF